MRKISEFNRRILLLKAEKERDSYGAEITNFALDKKLWASIKYSLGTGTETLENNKIKASNYATITVRHDKHISVENRIEYGGITYEIKAITDENAAHKYTVILCVVLERSEVESG